jgi:acetyl-CoA synthetase
VVHRHNAIIQEHMTAKWILDIHDDDVYWCTADPGWVTGVAYGILGSWSNNASSVVHAGRFNPKRWYEILDKYNVTIWYTAPTAIRMLMAAGNELPKKYDLSNLRHMCSVGEPLNPEAIRWGLKVFGRPFHDNWWQTETGGILIANYPSMPIKPGSMGKPLPGVTAAIIDDKGRKLKHGQEGHLAIKPGWPSMMKKIWRRPKKYKSYFMKGWYISGDRALTDKDGYFWFIGRADDVIKTSGERVGPFEVESALVEHPAVVEAGVIGKPDPLRGEIIKAFVVLDKNYKPSEKLVANLKTFVKKHLAGHAYPREIEFAKSLPKTRSGKIMRRVLKARELGLPIGDTSTLVDY